MAANKNMKDRLIALCPTVDHWTCGTSTISYARDAWTKLVGVMVKVREVQWSHANSLDF